MFKLSMIPFVPWSVYLVAAKKGFWKSLGLSIEVTIHPGEPSYVDTMVQKKADLYPLPLSSVLELFCQNNPFYCTGFYDQANGHKKIIVKQQFVSNLKNKTILVYADEVATRHFMARYLSTQELTLDDVHLVFTDSGSLIKNYIAPDVAACLVFEDDVDIILEKTVSQIVYSTRDYTDPFTLAVPFGKFNKDLEKDFPVIIQGRMQAVEWIGMSENQSEFCDIVNTFLFKNSGKQDDDTIMKSYHQLTHPLFNQLGYLNIDRVDDIFSNLTNTCFTNGIISAKNARDFNPDNILRHRYLVKNL